MPQITSRRKQPGPTVAAQAAEARAAAEAEHVARVRYAAKHGPLTERFLITPAYAAMVLARYSPPRSNRVLRRFHVARLTKTMSEGRWEGFSHQGIAFREDGTLMDGQHRLHASVESGQAFTTLVSYGLPASLFTIIDQQAVRKAADHVHVSDLNIPNDVATAAAARLLLMLDLGDMHLSPDRLSVYEYVRDHATALAPAVKIGLSSAKGMKAQISPAILSASAFLIREAGPDEKSVETFFGRLGDGAGLSRRSPILLLRECFKNGDVGAGYRAGTDRAQAAVATTINGWNLWMTPGARASKGNLLYDRGGVLPTALA